MSILDKRPAPWRTDHGQWIVQRETGTPIVDANGEMVCATFEDETEAHHRLIVAAPELLAALKCQVLARRDEGAESAGLRESEALIARIEGLANKPDIAIVNGTTIRKGGDVSSS